MLNEREKYLIAEVTRLEHWQAFEKWLREEISLLEKKEEFGSKICDDPLNEDFRVQMGIKIGMKMVLRKPKECFNELNKQEGKR